MKFKIPLTTVLLYPFVALGLCILENHRLAKNLETLNVVERSRRRVHVLEHHKGLTFSLERFLYDDVQDGTILGEDGAQGRGYSLCRDALLEVANVDSVRG
jgi:hypothetical protein